jgi:hypothetical protein
MTIRFHLDEHIHSGVLAGIRAHGIDVTSTDEAGLDGADDSQHIAFALAMPAIPLKKCSAKSSFCDIRLMLQPAAVPGANSMHQCAFFRRDGLHAAFFHADEHFVEAAFFFFFDFAQPQFFFVAALLQPTF